MSKLNEEGLRKNNINKDPADENIRKSLHDLFAQKDMEYKTEEFDWGEPVGREIIF